MSETPADGDIPADIAEPLTRWQRLAAWLIGLAAAGFGGYAVFASANQAGTALLLTIGAVFLVVAVQGTALRKFGLGANGSSVELTLRGKARRIEESAAAEPNPEVAEGMRKAAAIVAAQPMARTYVLGGDEYRTEVVASLRDDSGLLLKPPPGGSSDADVIAVTPAGVAVAVRTRFRMTSRASEDDLHQTRLRILLAKPSTPTVVVTNVPVFNPELNRNFGDRGEPPMEIAYWSNPEDTNRVVEAIERVAQFRRSS